MKRVFGAVIGLMGLATIAACETPPSTQELVEQGTLVPMTTEEIKELLTGRTEVWVPGAAYFREDGVIEAVWEGEPAEGTWWVENDILCYDVKAWGSEWCYDYYREGDQIVQTRHGEKKQWRHKYKDGKQL